MRILRLAVSTLFLTASLVQAAPQLSVEQLHEDLQFLRRTIADIHPQADVWTSNAQLEQAYREVRSRLDKPMDRDAAWRVLARLNPVFADAHLAVLQPDWTDQARRHLTEGGAWFPFEVHIGPSSELYIRAELGGAPHRLTGKRIDSINGVPARQVVTELLELIHGDTPAFRAQVLARRFWFFYWKRHGAPAHYQLAIEASTATHPASRQAPEMLLNQDNPPFERRFHYRPLDADTGLLTINVFEWADKKAWIDFTDEMFARLRRERVQTLLIDVRENVGGNDDLWKDGILRHIAARPYRHTSSYVKKVLPGRAGPGEAVGDVVHGTLEKWTQPALDPSTRFDGRVVVLVGGMTYSSAILFSNVIQDFGFGQLAGETGYARARQSGGVQGRQLPHTGLLLVVPRMVLDRPSGAREPMLVRPDLVVPDDPFDRQAMIRILQSRFKKAAATAP